MKRRLKINVGDRFDRLVVAKLAWPKAECTCSCGSKYTCRVYELSRGTTRSCGCLRREASGANSRKHVANTPEDFWKRVNKSAGCWEWGGPKNKSGYGKTSWRNRTISAHRVAWEIVNGDVPRRLFVCHHCDNPGCVRPDHLFLGTAKENTRDMWLKGRQNIVKHGRPFPKEGRFVASGEQNPAAKLTADQVAAIRAMYATKRVTQRSLAKTFDISESSISAIVRRVVWK